MAFYFQAACTAYQAINTGIEAYNAGKKVREVFMNEKASNWDRAEAVARVCGVILSGYNCYQSGLCAYSSWQQSNLNDIQANLKTNVLEMQKHQQALNGIEADRYKDRTIWEYWTGNKSEARVATLKRLDGLKAHHETAIMDLANKSQELQTRAQQILNSSYVSVQDLNNKVSEKNGEIEAHQNKLKGIEKDIEKKTADNRSWEEWWSGELSDTKKQEMAGLVADKKAQQTIIDKLIIEKKNFSSLQIKIQEEIEKFKMPEIKVIYTTYALSFGCDVVAEVCSIVPFQNRNTNIKMMNNCLAYYLHANPTSALTLWLIKNDAVFFTAIVSGLLLAGTSMLVNSSSAPAHTTTQQLDKQADKILPTEIPSEFLSDGVFQQHRCHYTNAPMRFPCRIRSVNPDTVYYIEKGRFYQLFLKCQNEGQPFIHPATGEIIALDHLVPDTTLQKIVDDRLRILLRK